MVPHVNFSLLFPLNCHHGGSGFFLSMVRRLTKLTSNNILVNVYQLIGVKIPESQRPWQSGSSICLPELSQHPWPRFSSQTGLLCSSCKGTGVAKSPPLLQKSPSPCKSRSLMKIPPFPSKVSLKCQRVLAPRLGFFTSAPRVTRRAKPGSLSMWGWCWYQQLERFLIIR